MEWTALSMFQTLWLVDQQEQRVDDWPRSVSPKATSRVQDRFIRNQAVRNRPQTANQIVANLHQTSGEPVRRLELVIIQPICMRDDPGLWLPWQIVALPTDVNGVGNIRTGIFVTALVSWYQKRLYSFWTSLNRRGLTGKRPRQPDRLGSGSVKVLDGITLTDVIVYKKGSLCSTTETTYWHPMSYRLLHVWIDVSGFLEWQCPCTLCTNRQCSPPSSTAFIKRHDQQWAQTFPPLNTSGTW